MYHYSYLADEILQFIYLFSIYLLNSDILILI